MKEVDIPKPLFIAIGALLLVGVAVGLYMSVGKPAPVVEPSSVSSTRLEDPDPRSNPNSGSGSVPGAN